jgi:hypothetical protein
MTSAPAKSQLSHLSELPIDWLKIDRAFIAKLPHDDASARAVPCGQLDESMARQQRGKHGKRQNQPLLGRLLQQL